MDNNRLNNLEEDLRPARSQKVVNIWFRYNETVVDQKTGEKHAVDVSPPDSEYEMTSEFDHVDGYKVRIWQPRPEPDHGILRDRSVTGD